MNACPSPTNAQTIVRPDGDIDLVESVYSKFTVVHCWHCSGGTLKPDFVFFGGNVPSDTTQASYDLVDRSDALLVRLKLVFFCQATYHSLPHRSLARAWPPGRPFD